MKMADILHSIADMLDKHEEQDIGGDNLGKEADDFQHEVEKVGKEEEGDGTTMVPPLQQKLELLKKVSGVPNMFDQGDDELDDIKKLTGIKAVIAHEAGEDNDITG